MKIIERPLDSLIVSKEAPKSKESSEQIRILNVMSVMTKSIYNVSRCFKN